MMVRIDPILVSVLQRRFESITKEMGLTLLRTTRSPILNEARDFVTGLYDPAGRMLEQTEYIPVLAFALQPACQYIINYFKNEIYPGDVILHNDVFSMGNQNADIAVYKPIFYDGKLVAWAACKGHQADVGGALAGGYNPQAREVWQEAIRIPPLKVYEKGKLRKDVWDMVFANIRFKMVEEDIRAELGSCIVGERGITGLVERYGWEVLHSHIQYLFDSTEKMMRQEIKAIPDGVYTGESYVFDDGITPGTRSRIMVTITVGDDEIHFDYTGTDPQTPGFVNAPFSSSASALILTFLMLINPDIPHNEGMLRPIHIHIPEGTIFNARFPAATTFGNHISDQHAEAIMKALSQALPERVTAAWNRMLGGTITGVDPRNNQPYVDISFLWSKGGSGATYGVDGYDHIGLICCAGGLLAQDYEMMELHDPHLLLYHEYATDSAGPGCWRGGLGTDTAFQIYGQEIQAVIYGDGVDEGAFGLFGGKEGTVNSMELVLPDGKIYRGRTKDVIPHIPKGTIWRQHAGGGGGYGDPYLRPADKVLEEVRNGFISFESARRDYGVVIDPQTLTLDWEETSRVRESKPERDA